MLIQSLWLCQSCLCQKLVASYVSMQALRCACLRRVKLPGPLPMALASQRTLALSSHTSTVLWLTIDYVRLSYQATKASARQCMLTFKGALCAGGVKYAAVRKTPEALLATPTRFPFEDRRGPAQTTSSSLALRACHCAYSCKQGSAVDSVQVAQV